jgi:regulator of protease activity HflC (stomatin/prohibitin superfamily)
MADINEKINAVPVGVVVSLLFLILIGLWGGFFIVNAGERGLIFNKFSGLEENVYGEGFSFKIPIIEKAIKMNIRVQKQAEETSGASSDLQDVTTTVAINYQADRDKLPEIYRTVGKITWNVDYVETEVMNPIIQESVKEITAKYTLEQLIKDRPKVKQEIDDRIKERLSKYGIVVLDVSITNFKPSQIVTEAIEQKMKADQQIGEAEKILEKKRVEKQQKIVDAEAEAQQIAIINDMLKKSPNYIEWMKYNKWTGVYPLTIGGNSLISIPFDK